MVAIALAFASSVSWGLADFLGGLEARRLAVLTVLLTSQFVALACVAVLVVASGADPPAFADVAPAMGGAILGIAALGAFYRALSIGTMSIVAPISATGAAVPVIAGVAGGDRPGPLQVAGIVAAGIGVVLAAREASGGDERRAADARQSVVLALLAALGFGTFVALLASAADDGVAWALLATRCASVPALVLVALVLRPARPPRDALPALAAVGVLDVGANALFAVASTEGLLSIVGVLASLYPVATVVLARVLLGERVRRVQEFGIVLALAGVAMMAAG